MSPFNTGSAFEQEIATYAIENADKVFRTASVTGGALLKRRKTINAPKNDRNIIYRHPNDDIDYMFIGGERVIFYKEQISELSYEDADFVIDVVEQYLKKIEGNEEDKRKIVRRYASLIISDIQKQIYEHTTIKTEELLLVEKDLILFRKFIKNVKKDGQVKFDRPFTDKLNIKKYLFTGNKKGYYTENTFDSDTERLFSIILEEDPTVIRWIKPPLNQLGLFWKAGQQYTPDFLVETEKEKYMVEVKSEKDITSDEVISKAREGIKWCKFASTVDPDQKAWKYSLISDKNIKLGNTCKYTLGTAQIISEE